MDKTDITSIILGIVFFLGLIVYAITSSKQKMFIHIILLFLGLFISVLMTNKVTKSSNPLKLKIYFSLITSLLIFGSIVFFWYLGNIISIDEMGLTTFLLILPSIILFAVISLVVGLILSISRKRRKDFDYNLKPFLWIFSIIFLILLILFFYNWIVVNLAILTNTKSICSLTISSDIKSNLFNKGIKRYCLLRSSTGESKVGDITCGELENIKDRNSCYRWTAQNRRDIKICIDNVASETEILRYNEYCTSPIRFLEEDIYTILKNPQHPDIMYALKSVHHSLGICYEEGKRYIPLLKEIIKQGSLGSKKEASDIFIEGASCLAGNSLDGEKEFLRNEILPLIKDQPELQSYIDRINQKLSAVKLKGTTSNIKTPTIK